MIEVAEKARIEELVAVDIETRRNKQQTMMVQLVERKVRSRAKQLYETRGQQDGHELQDWFQAESVVLENSVVVHVYLRVQTAIQEAQTAISYDDNYSPGVASP